VNAPHLQSSVATNSSKIASRFTFFGQYTVFFDMRIIMLISLKEFQNNGFRVVSPFLVSLQMCERLEYKKAVLPQGNRAMPQVFFSVEVRQQHSLQV